ncbi:Uncharacterized protein MA16_Dca025957 [Dendrobium catenatum]|uniref:DUF4283 domain-containing protein n=1 Tax=Dendrobium catenatum TaxID=906689 RepID=A0A2I0W4V2_9ASPA|nr:Uncharacterized protein MA16_Dca025957 [Dendrobium catenatum]
MARGGGLRSPPPNGGFGGRGGGKKEGRVGNRWQVLADEEAGGGEPAAVVARGGLPSRSPGIGRSMAVPSKGLAPPSVREEKGKKTAGIARPGKENDRAAIQAEELQGAGAASMVQEPATKFTPSKGKFELGISSSISKPLAVRELIMRSIGISPPAANTQAGTNGKSLRTGCVGVASESSSGHCSPRGSLYGSEEGQYAGPEREAAAASDMEDDKVSSPRDGAEMATGSEYDLESDRENEEANDMVASGEAFGNQTEMDEDLATQAELQLRALEAAVHPASRIGKSWADCTELHECPIFVHDENGDEKMMEGGYSKPFSPRRELPQGSANTDCQASSLCPQGVCQNASKQPSSIIRPEDSSHKEPSHLGVTPTNPFAWNKVQLVPISKLCKESFLGKDGKSVDPEIEAVHNNIAKLDRAIIAKVVGRRIAFPYLLTELKKRWFQFGEFEIVTIAPNSFICIFSSLEGRDAVLSGGPWIVGGNIIGMDRWSPSATSNSLHGLHSSIWIRLPQLPLMYWDTSNITRIANMLGDPMWMDSHTSKWGRSSFARICVRIDLSQRLMPGVWINGIHGCFFQKVEYEGLTNFCFDCGFIGHAKGGCSARFTNQEAPQNVDSARLPTTQPVEHQPAVPPSTDTNQARVEPPAPNEPEDNSFGDWNLVTRKKKGKAKQDISQPSHQRKQPPGHEQQAETNKAVPNSREELRRMEDISDRIVNPSSKHQSNHNVVFHAERSTSDPASLTVNLSKRQHKASKTYMEKQLLQLGPIATIPRKRRKNLLDDIGGDFVPFEDQ